MKFLVNNMSCKHCEMKITNTLKELGVKKIKVDLTSQTVEVNPGKLTESEIESAIKNIGYNFELL